MKKFNTFLLLAVTALMLSACGKNNKVGNAGGGSGLFVSGSGIIAPGQQTGSAQLDQYISQIHCQTGGDTRVFMSFTCASGGCQRSGGSGYQGQAMNQLRLGRTAYGDIAIVYYPNQNQAEMTFLMCQDALFNQQSIGNIQMAGLQILNTYVSQNGAYGQFIANVWFGIQYSGGVVKASFY